MRSKLTPSFSDIDYTFRSDEFWREVPAWVSVSVEEFENHRWQQQNSIKSTRDVAKVLGSKVDPKFLADIDAGLARTPMNVRITPYTFALIDWSNPVTDPIRKQFLPLGSEFLPDHPYCEPDSLAEDEDLAAPYLVHRYPDKVLFLPTTVCPVYCLFCTRSRIVGGSTATKEKASYGTRKHQWDETFEYIRNHTSIEDVVISGGDSYMLTAESIETIGLELLAIPHIRRIRFATKGLAVLPMRIQSDLAWTQALATVARRGNELLKEVCIHTHFSVETEITAWTSQAMKELTSLGVRVRNQTVLLRGVNDDLKVMYRTLKKLSYLNIQPYIVYVHDQIPGCEHLRTTVEVAEKMSKAIQGTTAGFNTPRFVCDAPGGGGKREISSYERYDRELGISAWTAPQVKPGEIFYYYDPIDQLPDSGQKIWESIALRDHHIEEFKRVVRADLNSRGGRHVSLR